LALDQKEYCKDIKGATKVVPQETGRIYRVGRKENTSERKEEEREKKKHIHTHISKQTKNIYIHIYLFITHKVYFICSSTSIIAA
jgi:hypothetical protein